MLQNASHSSDPVPYTSVFLDSINLHRGGDGVLKVLFTSVYALVFGKLFKLAIACNVMVAVHTVFSEHPSYNRATLRMAYNECCTVWTDTYSTV